RDTRHMGELGAGLVQSLLGNLAFRYVLKSTDEYGTPGDLLRDTGDAAHVLRGTSRRHNAEYEVDIRARHATRDHSVERRQVLGVDHVPNHQQRDLGPGTELEDAEGLLGPVVVVPHQVRDEAARLAQPLGFGETKVGLLGLRLRQLSIVNIGACAIPPHDLAGLVTERLGANEKPAIHAIMAAKTRLDLA